MQQRRSTARWLEQRRMHSPAHCIDDNGSPSCGDLACISLFHSLVSPFMFCYSIEIKPYSHEAKNCVEERGQAPVANVHLCLHL
uniref:Uncharacterized protein n=1 Tax=Oryza glumipatula TaxID=40148 RepID=A0A0D9Y7Y4_9ORYZ